ISGLPSPDLPGVEPLGAARTVSIVDRYIDTAAAALRAAGLAARVRTSSGDAPTRLTVKSLLPAGGGMAHRRLEMEDSLPGEAPGDEAPWAGAPCAAVPEATAPAINPALWPPSPARDAIVTVVGSASLIVIATIRQRRFQRDIRVDSARVELSLDDIESTGANGAVDRWVELEAELIPTQAGPPDAIDGLDGLAELEGLRSIEALGRRLAERPDLAAATSGKLDRALGLAGPR
ncbi:MAG: CYTH domain-containing protein, partial [Candidatus Limnocylindrales bacterium]